MAAALDSFKLAKADEKLLILGDMLELGKESQIEHMDIVQKLKALEFKNVILVGPEFVDVAEGSGFLSFENNQEALEYLKINPVEGKLVLLKGSRGIALEVLLEVL
jgi:UDP-N-acetylmuramoyl-tripeptide--D-alanyl-D-alanine ligase